MQKLRKPVSLILILSVVFSFTNSPPPKVKWMDLKEMQEAYAKEPRPILIDMYTSWCGWCKVMDKKTYTNENVVAYINKKFYAVKFNAESKATLSFLGKDYAYNKKEKIHELAKKLAGYEVGFPSTILLSKPEAPPAVISGYMIPSEMEAPLKYFGSNANEKQSFIEFEKALKKEW